MKRTTTAVRGERATSPAVASTSAERACRETWAGKMLGAEDVARVPRPALALASREGERRIEGLCMAAELLIGEHIARLVAAADDDRRNAGESLRGLLDHLDAEAAGIAQWAIAAARAPGPRGREARLKPPRHRWGFVVGRPQLERCTARAAPPSASPTPARASPTARPASRAGRPRSSPARGSARVSGPLGKRGRREDRL